MRAGGDGDGWGPPPALPPPARGRAAGNHWLDEIRERWPHLPENIRPCPACGILIEKIDGDDEVMCGCEARPAGGTYEKALRGGGCGYIWNFETGEPMGQGERGHGWPDHPANERQAHFREGFR